MSHVLRGKPVLLTGGAGFIGSHLVDALLERGARVRVFDDLSTEKRENLAGVLSRIDLQEGGIRDTDACGHACEGSLGGRSVKMRTTCVTR